MKFQKLAKLPIVLGIGAGLAAGVHAQQLEEIIVTAQKRAESMQDVPISLSAVSGSLAEDLAITSTEGLTHAVPGLAVVHNGTAPTFYLRGIGSFASQTGQESAIATFVDGVYQPSFNGALLSFNNIERVEVLKGPQGTLFGRNATGGAVNVITKDPSFDPSLQAELGYGNHDTVEGNFYGTMGLTDKIAVDLALYHSEMHEGYGENVITGEDANIRKDRAYRAKVLIDATDNTQIVLAAGKHKTWGNNSMSYRWEPSTQPLLNPTADLPPGTGFWDIASDNDPNGHIEGEDAYIRVTHDFGGATLTSITAYAKIDVFQDGDLDTSPLTIADYISHDENPQFTQEIQLASNSDGRLNWIIGAFYMDAEAEYKPLHIFGPLFSFDVPGLLGSRTYATQETTSIAGFGQFTYALTDKLDVTAGFRYTRDERDFEGVTQLDFGAFEVPVDEADASSDAKEPTWRLALDYQINDNVMAFVSYNRGFKSGAFNTTLPADPPTEPEQLDAYEIGLKTELFDNRLRLNMAAYFYDYSEIQLAKIEGAGQQTLNAAEAEVKGFDMDFQAVLTDNLSLYGGFAYIDGEYTEFEGAPISFPVTTFPFGVAFVDCVADPAGCDASGNTMIRTPEFTYNLAAVYNAPLAAGDLELSLSYSYNDGFYFEVDNRIKQDSYGIINAQAKWTSPDGRYYIRAYGRNLGDEEYYAQYQEIFSADLVTATDGRTYGMAVGIQF